MEFKFSGYKNHPIPGADHFKFICGIERKEEYKMGNNGGAF